MHSNSGLILRVGVKHDYDVRNYFPPCRKVKPKYDTLTSTKTIVTYIYVKKFKESYQRET
jgi:O-acetylhomoserine/O-acetylserine sulfhydrylase-like pyridoxal-dependent enzyme